MKSCCSSKLGEFVLIIKQKPQPNILHWNLSWTELDLFTYCYSALLWKEFEIPVMKRTLFLCFDEANKSWVGFINSKYRAEVFCVLWCTMAGVRLVGRTHTGAGWSEAHGFKQIGVELQGSLLHLREDLRCDLSSNLLSYAVLFF